MHAEISLYKIFSVTILVIIFCITGCKEDNSGRFTQTSTGQKSNEFILNYDNSDQPQALITELFLRNISVYQYHIGQDQPTLYSANQISKIVMYNTMHSGTKEWFLDRMEIYLKDGSTKLERCTKVWNVDFNVASGHGANPVSIEQHFIKK